MKSIYAIIALNLVSMVCVGFAGYMAVHGIGNWGWFLGCGMLSAVNGVKFGKE